MPEPNLLTSRLLTGRQYHAPGRQKTSRVLVPKDQVRRHVRRPRIAIRATGRQVSGGSAVEAAGGVRNGRSGKFPLAQSMRLNA